MRFLHAPTGTSIDVTDSLLWTDRLWSPVVESSQYLLPDAAGASALLVKRSRRAGGRPYTLQSPDSNTGLVRLSVLLALQTLADAHPESFQWTAWGETRTVTFRYGDGAPVSGESVLGFTNWHPDEFWTITLKLREAQ